MRLNGFHSVIMNCSFLLYLFQEYNTACETASVVKRLCEWKLRFDILMKSNM